MTHLLRDNYLWEINFPCRAKAVIANYNCPKCSLPGHQRLGIYFDREWRCADCEISWEPGLNYLYLETI